MSALVASLGILLVIIVPLARVNAQAEFLNPDKIFEALKENITIPLPNTSIDNTPVPSPEQALEKASPKLREVNQEVQNETGIDFAKLIGWFAKVLRVFFLTIVNILETVAQALEKNKECTSNC